MALQLESLQFSVDTTELKAAVTELSKLSVAVSEVNKKSADAAIKQEKLALAQEKTAKAAAEAALAEKKLYDANDKSIEAANKRAAAEEKKQQTLKKTQAIEEETTNSTLKGVDRIVAKTEYMAKYVGEGFRSSAASVLTQIQLLGGATEEQSARALKALASLAANSKNPFDSVIGPIQSINHQLEKLTNRANLSSQGIGLSSKQLEEYSRIYSNIASQFAAAEKDISAGKGQKDFTKMVADQQAAYIKTAKAVNDLELQEKKRNDELNKAAKGTNDSAKAMAYIEHETLRAKNALEGFNEGVQISTSNRLLKFKEMLVLTGVEAKQAAIQFEEYKKNLLETDKARKKAEASDQQSKINNLSRGLAPQISDVAVSLYGGMSPMTVLMQQGLQVRDLIQSSGVEAKNLNKTLQQTGADFLGTLSGTFKAIGALGVGVFSSIGSSIVDTTTKFLGLKAIADIFRNSLHDMFDLQAVWKFNDALKSVNFAISAAIGATVGAVAIFATALTAAFISVQKEESALSKSMIITGASFGLSKQAAIEYANSMQELGVSQSKATEFITALGKEGGFTKQAITDLTKAAVDLNKYGGVAIEDTVNQAAKFKDKPYDALVKFAEQTGLVTIAQLENVKTLEDQGKTVEATEAAIKAFGMATQAQADLSKASLSPIQSLWIDITKSVNGAWEALKELARGEKFVEVLRAAFAGLSAVVQTMWTNIQTVGKGVGALAGMFSAAMSGDFSAAKGIFKEFLVDIKSDVKSIGDNFRKNLSSESTDNLNEGLKLTAKQMEKNIVAVNTWAAAQKVLDELQTKGVKREEGAIRIRNILTKQGIDELTIQKAIAEFNARNKDRAVPEEDYYKGLLKKAETARDLANLALNAEEKLTASQKAMVDLTNDSKFIKLSKSRKEYILTIYAEAHANELARQAEDEAIKLREEQSKATQKVSDELEKLNVVNIKSIPFQQMLDEMLITGKITFEQSVEAINKYSKALANISSEKFAKEIKAANYELDAANERLVFEASIIGKTTEEQKKLTAEYQIQAKYKKALIDIEADKTLSEDDRKTKTDAEVEYRNKALRNLNKEIAFDAAKKLLEEYNRIRDGISDAIVTALFEGGKAGSKKLRDLIIAELKKPITIVVKALVDTMIGSVTGGKLGSTLSSGLNITDALGLTSNTGLLGSIAGSAGSYATAIGGSAAAGSQAAMLAAQTAEFGAAGLAATAEAAGGAFASLGSAVSTASSALAAIPGWGWALAGAALLISGMDNSGTMHTGGIASYNSATGTQTSTTQGAFGTGFGSVDYGKQTTDMVSGIAKGISQMLDATATTFGKTVGYSVATAFADDTSKDGAWGALVVKLGDSLVTSWEDSRVSKWAPKVFADGEAGAKEYALAVAKDVRDVLLEQTPDWADTMLKALGDAPTLEGLTAVVAQINAVAKALESMKEVSKQFVGLSEEVTSALIKSLGGAEAALSKLNAYYGNFFSEEERKALTLSQLQKDFTSAGLGSIPKTREEYRKLVEAQDLTTEAGRKQYAELVKLAPAFASATSSIEDTAKAAKDAAEEIIKANKQLYDDAKSATDKALADTKEVINREKEKAQVSLDAATATKDSIKSVFDLLQSSIKELYAEVSSTAAMQVSEANLIISNAASSGVLPSSDILSGAISTVRSSIGSTNYTSKFEADKARLDFVNNLKLIQDQAGLQLTESEQQVKLLKDQIEQYDLMLVSLDEQLKVLRGISTSNLSIDDSLRILAEIAQAEKAAKEQAKTPSKANLSTDNIFSSGPGAPYTGTGSNSGFYEASVGYYSGIGAISDFYNSMSGWDNPQQQVDNIMALYNQADALNVSANQISTAIGIPTGDIQQVLADLGLPPLRELEVGTNYVPRDGVAYLHEGEAVVPKQYNPYAGGSTPSTDTSETDALRIEVRATAQSTAKLARLVERLIVPTPSGEALQTTTVVA